jgi:hypothetical protein
VMIEVFGQISDNKVGSITLSAILPKLRLNIDWRPRLEIR